MNLPEFFEKLLDFIPDFPGVSRLFSFREPEKDFVDLKDIKVDKKNSSSLIGRLLLFLVFFLASGLILVNLRLSHAQRQIKELREQHLLQQQSDSGKFLSAAERAQAEKPLKSAYTVLVLGAEDDRRSDTIMLCHFFLDRSELRILSIPRDTRVMMTHNDELVMDKIAHAYRFGGVKQIRQVLSDFLGLKIDFHYVIDLAIFKKIIDAVGGVEIDVQQDLKYEDKAGGLKIDITKGKQLLNGHDAEGFVRYRDEKQGDLGRIERQQQFIKAFSQKISSLKELSWENIKLIGRLPGFAVDLFRDIDTDMSLDFFLKLYMAYSDRSFRNLHYATLGGEGEYLRDFTTKKWISYYISTRQDRYKSSAWLLDRAVEDIFIVNEEFAWLSSLSVSEQRMVSGVDSLSGQIVTTVSNSLSQLSSMTAASQAGQDFVTDSVISLPVETVLAVVPVSVSTTDIPVKKVEDSVSGSILETMPVSVSDLTVKTNAEVTLEPFLLESSVANKNITSGFVFTQEEIKAAVSELPLRFSTSSMVVSSTGAALIMTE